LNRRPLNHAPDSCGFITCQHRVVAGSAVAKLGVVRPSTRAMRAAVISFFIAVAMLTSARAQEHLVPESGLLAKYDDYHFKIRELA
jgi:hypothetical protein